MENKEKSLIDLLKGHEEKFRQTGRTSLIAKAINHNVHTDFTFVVYNLDEANRIKKTYNIDTIPVHQAIRMMENGTDHNPFIFDHLSILEIVERARSELKSKKISRDFMKKHLSEVLELIELMEKE